MYKTSVKPAQTKPPRPKPVRPKTIAEIVEDAMAERDLSQSGLAALIGVPPSTVNRYFSGQRELGSRKLERIFQALDLIVVRKP